MKLPPRNNGPAIAATESSYIKNAVAGLGKGKKTITIGRRQLKK